MSSIYRVPNSTINLCVPENKQKPGFSNKYKLSLFIEEGSK
jgi:hypothetical protein